MGAHRSLECSIQSLIRMRKIQRQHVLLHQLVGLFIFSNDTKCTLLFSLAFIRDAFWIVNSENDKLPFRELLTSSVWPGKRADGSCSRSPTLSFFSNNTRHLKVLSLSYLHKYSRVPHTPAETYRLCFCLFLMCYHIVFFFLRIIFTTKMPPGCLLPGVVTQLESLA